MFDGEGSVTISLRQGKYVAIELCVSQKYPAVLTWFEARFGGHIYKSKDYASQWKLFGQNAVDFLSLLDPYLIVKAADSEEARRIWEAKHDPITRDVLMAKRRERKGHV